MRKRSLGQRARNSVAWTTAQALRLVPGSWARRTRRDLRDAVWLRQADAVIISFPKSGRTFVRAMLSRLFQRRFGIDERNLLEFSTLRKAPGEVPRLLFTHAGDAMRRPHEIALEAADYAHCRVVLLARHPADVAISRYYHLKHRSRERARRRLAEQPLDLFIWTEQGGIPSIVRFMNICAELAASREDFGIVRYEDFLSDPHQTLRALAARLALAATEEDVDDAVEFGSFEKLKTREREGYFSSSRLQPARSEDGSSFKVRSGGSGGYRKRLQPREAAKVDAYIAEHLHPVFGYGERRGRHAASIKPAASRAPKP